jgi:Tol biopolymer transport system component
VFTKVVGSRDTIQLTHGTDSASSPFWSPDGATIYFASRGGLWAVGASGGTPELKHQRLSVRMERHPWLGLGRIAVVVDLVQNHGETGNLSILDVKDGSSRVNYRSRDLILHASVSHDGRRIAYSVGTVVWSVLEISVPEGRVRTAVGGGGISWDPEWAPSGTHFLYSTSLQGRSGIEDRSAAEGYSRLVVEEPEAGYTSNPRWAPDGTRFLFLLDTQPGTQLMIANATGGRSTALAGMNEVDLHTWSPDGQWIAILRHHEGKLQLAKMRPVSGATAVPFPRAAPVPPDWSKIEWSPAGGWIAYPSAEGVSLISEDGNTDRKLTGLRLAAFAFSKNGAQMYGILSLNSEVRGPFASA